MNGFLWYCAGFASGLIACPFLLNTVIELVDGFREPDPD